MTHKKIVLKAGSKGALLLEEMQRRKKELEEKLSASLPPTEIRKYIDEVTKSTGLINQGRLDEESFRLAMYTMYRYLYDNKLLKDDKEI